MEFLERLRDLSEGKKKIILWTTVVVIGLIMITVWIFSLPEKMEKTESSDYFQKLEESFENAR